MDSKKALELSREAYPTNENLRIAYMLGLNKGWNLHDEHSRKGLVLRDGIKKLVKWSEEDEEMVNDILDAIDDDTAASSYHEMEDWLKNIKQRIGR